MKRRLLCGLIAALMIIGSVPAMAYPDAAGEAVAAASARQMENLNRGGFAATNPSGGVYLSWRLLGSEPMDTVFNVYKNGAVLVEGLNNTSYTDAAGTKDDKYSVAAYIGGAEGERSGDFPMLTGQLDKNWKNSPYAYFDIPVQFPEDGADYTYNTESTSKGESGGPNDLSVGDVDGDGEYEVILKWDPSNSKDSASSGATGLVYIDCYEMDGTMLWRINLGRNIRAGAHYTQFQVYDYDGDGKAEVAVKTAPGTIDGRGNFVSDAGNTEEIRTTDNTKTYYGTSGHIESGPEYLTIFNGESGAAMQTIDYDPPVGIGGWGDSKFNRSDRYLAATAYFDGVHPSMVFCRGYYGRAVIAVYNWDGKDLKKLWRIDSNDSGNSGLAGQGNHNLSIADLDNDGFDEIVYGAAAVDHDGTVMWSAYSGSKKIGHGDAMHVSDFDDDGEQEVFKVAEDSPNWGAVYIDGKSGDIIWHHKSTDDDGRGIMDNFSPKYGVLAWDGALGIRTMDDKLISKATIQDNKWSYPNFAVYWDGDFYREHLDATRVQKWNDYAEPDADGNLGSFGRIMMFSGVSYNNSTKKNPGLSADLFGDWREEIIYRTADNSALRVFTSLIPTEHKMTTLMHDSQYRCGIAWQNTAYNQPPHLSYLLTEGKTNYAQPNIYTIPIKPEIRLTAIDAQGAPLSGVKINLGGIEKPTDKNGEVSYRMDPGTYKYSVDQLGYVPVSGEVTLAQDAECVTGTVSLTQLPDSTVTVVSGGQPVSGASVVIGDASAETGADGVATMKLAPGEQDYTVSCDKYLTKTGRITVPENGEFHGTIELESIGYVYDSDKDVNGGAFKYTGGDGAELTFVDGQWVFTQNSTDGGREFGAAFERSTGGNVEFEMIYATGGTKDASGNWNWSGRSYTHHVELLDADGKVLIGICQPYTSKATETQYYTGVVSKKNVKGSGTVIGGPNITSRSASTWKLKFNINLAAKTVTMYFTDEAGANGYEIKDIPIDVNSFAGVKIYSEASGNVTWTPKVKGVLYKSDCLGGDLPPAADYEYMINSVVPALSGSVNVNLTKNKEAAAATVIVAAYDKTTGALASVGTANADNAVGETKDINVKLSYDENDTVIAYVWNSMSGIVPMAEGLELK